MWCEQSWVRNGEGVHAWSVASCVCNGVVEVVSCDVVGGTWWFVVKVVVVSVLEVP